MIKYRCLFILIFFLITSPAFSEDKVKAGEEVISKYKCRRCHTIDGKGEEIGPDLKWTGEKLNIGWLFDFLKTPHKIRPLKTEEMPEFVMPDEDIHAIIEYFSSFSDKQFKPMEEMSPQDFSDGEMLYKNVLGCSGCHSINNEGGWVGPELSNAATRLNKGWIRKWLKNPQAIYPGTNMPGYNLDAWELTSLTAYISNLKSNNVNTEDDAEYEDPAQSLRYISSDILSTLPKNRNALRSGEDIYLWYCSHCHGIKGDGRGFNTQYLEHKPKSFQDRDYMARFTDKELYEIISGGGRAVGKSPYMPPWGKTITKKQIQSVIKYIRSTIVSSSVNILKKYAGIRHYRVGQSDGEAADEAGG